MEEIEISNRLYHEDGTDYMTAVLPGHSTTIAAMAGPVTFILTERRIVTVRHHTPRPFETFPERAGKANAGCGTADHLFLGLVEEIVARLADLLEAGGRALDTVARSVYGAQGMKSDDLRDALTDVGRQGELLGRVRLGLLTTGRALGHFRFGPAKQRPDAKGDDLAASLERDIHALEVHADFLGSRMASLTDATLGMINLAQNATVRNLSVISVLFLPPTLIASAYGMNFVFMPELEWAWGYLMALGLMLASAVGSFLFFRWRRWL
jgi:magnesium transporter